MAVGKRTFRAEATPINAQALGTTQQETLSTDIDLETDGYVGSHITVDAAFSAAGTVNVQASVYGSLDGVNYDDVPAFSQEIAVSAGNSRQISLIVTGLAHFRVGVKHPAAEANPATVTVKEQSWRYDIS